MPCLFYLQKTTARKGRQSRNLSLGTRRSRLPRQLRPSEYEAVPVLRNMVPSQVLLGNSSFNTGNSISAGMPDYARNRAKAIAEIMERG